MTTVQEFISKLDAYCKHPRFTTLQKFHSVLDKSEFSDWQGYVQFDDASYKRNIIEKNPFFELTLICWKNGQSTPFHNHPHNGCLIKILSGELHEVRRGNKKLNEQILAEKTSIYMCNDYGEHKITNRSGSNTISLHMYSPGME